MLPIVEKNDKSVFLDAHRLLWSRICLWLRNLDTPITKLDFDAYKRNVYMEIANDIPIYERKGYKCTLTSCFLCDYGRVLANIANLNEFRNGFSVRYSTCNFCPAYIMAQKGHNDIGCLDGLYGTLLKCVDAQEYSDAYYIAVLIRDTPFCSLSKENNKTDYEEIINYLINYLCSKGVSKNVNS